MHNKSIVYELYCIEKLSEELNEHEKELVKQHIESVREKFNLLLQEEWEK